MNRIVYNHTYWANFVSILNITLATYQVLAVPVFYKPIVLFTFF